MRNPPICPFPKILSTPRLPKVLRAPVARCGATFAAPFVIRGNALAPKEIKEDRKLPPSLTAFLICVFEILISAPFLS